MNSWQLAMPWALALLLLLPWRRWYQRRHFASTALHYPTLSLYQGGRGWRVRRLLPMLQLLEVIALVLLIMALARPQKVFQEHERLTEGVDIILAIDTSGSMQALDFRYHGQPQDRLAVIQRLAADFIERRQNDRMGLVMFGDSAFTQCPLTLDHRLLIQFLNNSSIGMAGTATAIGSAIAVATKRLENSTAKSKVIILLTDGSNNAGNIEPQVAAQLAATFHIKIYTIGVGSHGPVPFPERDIFGERIVQRVLELDEESLKNIAATTGGTYFNAQDTASLESIYQQIDALEKTEVKVKEYRQVEERFAYFLIPGMALLWLLMLLRFTWLRQVPACV